MSGKSIRMILCATAGLSLLLTGTASADTPTGTCTNSYQPYGYADLSFDPAAQAIFSVIDTNHDNLICFKYYPNGPHDGHAGNLVDDKAGPHI